MLRLKYFLIFFFIFLSCWKYGVVAQTPTIMPTFTPSEVPTIELTPIPTANPTVTPTATPTKIPTNPPSYIQTDSPSDLPTPPPTVLPSLIPTRSPSETPTVAPTETPSTAPSFLPSEAPTEIPSFTPSEVPTASPTYFPSHFPSSQPTAVPSRRPSIAPTSRPSRIPTTHPSDHPTGQPSNPPSSQPTGQPVSSPSMLPSAQPTNIPSSQPIALPSSYPSSQPIGLPTAAPSSQPSLIPSSMPSSAPTAVPIGKPTGQPSGLPTGNPTRQPTSEPTSEPSKSPLAKPSLVPNAAPTGSPITSKPTKQPSSDPTGQPSKLPTSTPSSQPTSLPTTQPSGVPSIMPSSVPSAQPISLPSSLPTGLPTSVPSTAPSCLPSSQPTTLPSSQPTRIPTSQPTSLPTTRDSPRYFTCDETLTCESNSLENCSFFTGAIVLECTGASNNCLFNVGSFAVGPDTELNVTGNCSLTVFATSQINIYEDVVIRGNAINFTSAGPVSVAGTVMTSGRGPYYGPGFAANIGIGAGGSYGGSGGKNSCNKTSFSVIDYQIGSVRVSTDLRQPDEFNPTYGSGGGKFGGRGGGRILLNSANVITVQEQGKLLAEGSEALATGYGAGSGGGILIRAYSFYNYGTISVQGGASNVHGGGGGGGRISLEVISDQDISNSQILKANIAGGKVGSINELTQRPQCLSGGAGTISFQPSMGTTVQNLFAFTFNEGSKTQAGTPLSFLPSTTLKFTSSRVNLIGSSFHLKSQGTCDSDQSTAVTSPLCSSISLINSTLHCQNQTLVFIYDYYHTFNLRSCGLIADIVSLNNSLLNIYASDGFYGSGKLFTLSSDSKIDFGTYAFLNSTKNIELYGEVRQVPSRSYRGVSKPTFRIDSEGNVTVQTILADKVIISGRNIKILPKANLETMSKSPSNCINSVNATLTACTLPEVSLFNSIKWFQAEKEITAETGFRVSAAMISMCADSIKFSGNTTIFADGLGCSANNGTGTGGSAVFGVAGGAGGAYSGNGGYGYNNLNYGQSYDSSGILSSGSGGGCSAPTKSDCYEGSSGGGIINFYASKSIALNANVSTAGIAGSYCGGGGAGGGISLVTSTLTGTGSVKANGGMGGTCAQPGGGGGGGFIQIYSPNPSGDYSSYKFYGSIVSLGGLPGVTTAVNPGSMSNNYVSKVLPLLSVHIASIQAATSGSNGVIGVPNCEAGYGSNPTDGKICSVCPTGTWSPGGTSDCLQCTNAPSHSSYIDEQVTTSNCPYECDSGYSTNSCLNQLQLFIYNTLTLGGLAGVCVGILALIFVPLLYYRYKRHNDWGDKKADQGDFFSKVMFFGADLGFGADDPMNKSRGVSGKLNYTENPLSLKSSTAIDDIEDIKVVAIRKLQPKRGKEMRREHRMADQDMIFHACRVNLYGQNHPHQSRGGPWIMSNKRPNCLKPTLKKREYQELAERINDAVSWNQYGSEMMIFYLLSFLIPPLSAYIMKGYRRRRAAILMNVIANYDYSCFRCPEQRRSKNSLRIGISPDATLAYIDFLFDDEAYSKKTKPLCPLGQAKLPAAFRFAGLGTYHAPFYVDTNDLILQAVPQTDVASAFIDGAWINFVVELNTILRTLQTDALYEGIVSMIKFLSDSKNSQNLGGLIIEFCTFNNIPKIEEREVIDPTADQVVVDQRESNTIGKQETGRAISNSDPLAAPFEPDRTSYEEKTTRLFSVETWFKSLQRKPTTDRDRRTLNRSTKTGMSTSDKASMSFRPGGDTLFQKKSEASSTDSNLYFIARCMKSILNFILCRRKQNDHVEDFDLPSQKESEVGVKVRDPSGVERIMSFPEILSAIRKGDVTMGIVVSHPKVLGDVYIAKDEDYESGDDLDDDLISEDVGLPTAAELKRSFSDDTESSGYQKTTSLDTLEDPLFRAYGSKAEQMAKFYRIMQQSEKEPSDFSMAASPSSDRKLEIYEIASSPAAVAIPIDFEGSDPFQKKLSTEDSPKETPPILTREQRRASLGPLKSTEQPTDTYTEFSQARGSVAGEDARPMSVDITKFPRQESRVVEDEAGLSSFERLGRPMSRPLSRRDEGSTEDLQELQKAILTSSSAGTSRPASVGIHTEPSPKDLISALDLSEKESPSKKDGDKSPPPPLSQSPANNFSHSPKSEKVNITSPPSTKETNQLRSKSRKRPKKTKLNMPLHNLAPSCFQHFAKAWRFTINEYEPTTDGKLGPKYIRTIVNLDEDDEDEPEIAAKKGALDVESQPVVGGGLIKDSNNSSRNSSQHRRSGNYSRDSYRDNRESFFHTLMQISFTENQKRGFGGATGTGGVNVAPSSDPNNPRVSSYRKSEAAETRTIRSINSMNFSSMNNSGIFGNLWLQKQFQYLYYNGFFLHYFTRFMFGCNVYPYGPKNFRKLFELVAFILCIADLTLWVLMLINTSCVSSNTTACNDQTALIVVICVWPLAFLVAPLMGITAILLGPSGALARHYALWSRLAAMNNGLMLFITFKYLDYYYNVTGGIYFVIVVTSSRVFQCQLVDYYVAHIERLRYTRGWDGLSTSLFKTKDNKKEIGL